MDDLLQVQLNKLQTDHIDYYLLHGLDRGSWEKMRDLGALEFLDKAKTDGRIIHAGFSFHGDKDTFKEIVDAYDWEFCQIQYNFLDEQNQAGREGLEYAAGKGLGVVIMEPLRGGNLTRRVPPAIQEIWDQAEVKRTPVEWALRWIWNRPEVTVVLSGMNEEEHIEENIRIASEAYPDSLTQEELDRVARVRDAYRDLMAAGCTGCRYCMPCPAGVNIPMCFEVYNNAYMFGQKRMAKMMYAVGMSGTFDGKPAYASQCKNCGKCEKACPQHLPVPQLLNDVANEFEGLSMKPVIWFFKGLLNIQRWRSLRRARSLRNQDA
jgi:predicted aldo/keto reductase-like oxidoreductase